MVAVEIAIVLMLVLLNGFFAMSELAVVSARPGRLQQLAKEGVPGAEVALQMSRDPGRFLSAVQIGITLIGILAGAVSGATLAEKLGAYLNTVASIQPYGHGLAIIIVVLCITYLSLILGELVPKQIALSRPEAIATRVSRPLRTVASIGAPIVSLLHGSTAAVLRLLRINPMRSNVVTEEELRTLIAEGTRAGIFEPAERQMIEGVLRLADRPVSSIMTPRPHIIWVDPEDPIEESVATMRQCGFSRLLVSRGAVDEVLGIVRKKDLLDRLLAGESLDLLATLRQPLAVHERTSILKLLELFKATPVHSAIVVDEYGTLQGLVTLTDVLEAIAGDLPQHGAASSSEVVRRQDGSFLFDGMISVDEADEILGGEAKLGNGDYNTLAGFVLFRLGRMPTEGDAFVWRDWRFEVVDMDGRRIDKVLVSRVVTD